MPFVNVTSIGGAYDDVAYTAGWEMGELYFNLVYNRPAVLEKTIRKGNVEQADLIAMGAGYETIASEAEVDGWYHLLFTTTEGQS